MNYRHPVCYLSPSWYQPCSKAPHDSNSIAAAIIFPILLVFWTYPKQLSQTPLATSVLWSLLQLFSASVTYWAAVSWVLQKTHLFQIRAQPRCTQLKCPPSTGNTSPDTSLDPIHHFRDVIKLTEQRQTWTPLPSHRPFSFKESTAELPLHRKSCCITS